MNGLVSSLYSLFGNIIYRLVVFAPHKIDKYVSIWLLREISLCSTESATMFKLVAASDREQNLVCLFPIALFVVLFFAPSVLWIIFSQAFSFKIASITRLSTVAKDFKMVFAVQGIEDIYNVKSHENGSRKAI